MKYCILVCMLFLYSCSGGRPLYVVDENKYKSVDIAVIAERDGQLLRNELMRMYDYYPHNLHGYRIKITLKRKVTPFAFDKGGISTRLEVNYEAQVSVFDKIEHELVLKEIIDTVQSIDTSESEGEIIRSMYPDYEKSFIKKLASQIFESINVKMQSKKQYSESKL